MNHKGTPCILDKRLCQEGYCSGCELWVKWDRLLDSIREKTTR